MSFRAWVGIWQAIILLLFVAFDVSAAVRYITRFTEESFTALIALIFIWEAFSKLIKRTCANMETILPEIFFPNYNANSTITSTTTKDFPDLLLDDPRGNQMKQKNSSISQELTTVSKSSFTSTSNPSFFHTNRKISAVCECSPVNFTSSRQIISNFTSWEQLDWNILNNHEYSYDCNSLSSMLPFRDQKFDVSENDEKNGCSENLEIMKREDVILKKNKQ